MEMSDNKRKKPQGQKRAKLKHDVVYSPGTSISCDSGGGGGIAEER